MSRYIDADKLLKSTISKFKCVPLVGVQSCRNGEECFDGEDFESLINEAPTADVVEVRHGEWILKDSYGNGICSVCNRLDRIDSLATHCRYCGAKMREERKENER